MPNDALKRARKKYRAKTKSKTISFNLEAEDDILAFMAAEKIKNFSGWVKAQLLKESKGKSALLDGTIS